jgi:hypothetical protein
VCSVWWRRERAAGYERFKCMKRDFDKVFVLESPIFRPRGATYLQRTVLIFKITPKIKEYLPLRFFSSWDFSLLFFPLQFFFHFFSLNFFFYCYNSVFEFPWKYIKNSEWKINLRIGSRPHKLKVWGLIMFKL